ncbi:hypothetical protein IFM89_014462 [Coptis chinensis]|uniref:B box-type domain-containing protein n=1 Tax=Coptis chinensis TaxID=261450 RepID=A0A835I509_9MAGN|nr:hypothetical protein IFM89_014462 [Coptis chinensis]
MIKECDLCNLPAKMYCESDQASLCWNCDSKIHSANFLVAKHTRSLLCHLCQFPTSWTASGPKLGSTVSMCEVCVVSNGNRIIQRDQEEEEEEIEESQGGNEDEEDSVSDAENQVVPRQLNWSGCSSTKEEEEEEESTSSSSVRETAGVSLRKRMRDDEDLEETTSVHCFFKPLKDRKREELDLSTLCESDGDALVSSLRKFHHEILTGYVNTNLEL